MPIPAYTPGYPPDGSSLGQTKSTIRNNLDGTFQTLNIDHVNNNGQPGSNPAGYHTSIHMVPQASITNTAGYGQLYSQTITDVNTDQALFWNTGTGNRTVQMTVPIVPSAAANGYTFLPGGLIIQWGQDTKSTGQNTNFPLTFPNNVFSVVLTLVPATATANGFIRVSSQTTAHFQISNTSGNAQSYTYNWMAIGN